MKRTILLVLMLLVVSLLATSCFNLTDTYPDNSDTPDNPDDSGNDGSGDGAGDISDDTPVDYGTATVYLEGTPVVLTANSTRDYLFLAPFRTKLLDLGCTVTQGSQFNYEADNEVYIGKVPDREICSIAYELMERMDKDSVFECRYLVYASSGRIAIAFDDNPYTDIQVPTYIIDELITKGSGNDGYFALGEGVVMSGTVDLIDKQEEIDTENLRKIWEEVERLSTPQVYEALRKVYSMYDDKLIGWYANLYDPGVGGYYATSSGRDHQGYLPDPESTKQALNFIENSGMLDELPGGYEQNIPKIMKYQIIYYCKSIQYKNGYFYNPIVPRSSLNTPGNSKRGRDLGWCTSMLSDLGSAPQYTTPTGVKGDGISADEFWDNLIADGKISADTPRPQVPKNPDDLNATATVSLGESAIVAVSKIIDTSDAALVDSSTDYLGNYKMFVDYMWKLNLDGNPYAAGNELNATYSQIASASKNLVGSQGKYSPDPADGELYQKYANMDLKEICIAILNERINPETGLWGDTTTKYPKGTEFLFTNGFFKLITLYNSWRIAYPYPVKAANALLDGMVSDQPSLTNICEVYNIWAAIVSLKSNIKYCDNKTYAEVSKIISDTLDERGPLAIETSYIKQLGYKKEDGGYSHHVDGSATSHQGGIPTGLGLDEGDVDAIGKATTGLFQPMLDMFGLPDVPLYTTHHWMMYLEILLTLKPVVKYSYTDGSGAGAGASIHEYDDMPASNSFSFSTNSVSDNTVTVTTEGGNGVLKMDKKLTGKQLVGYFAPNVSNVAANGIVFETDMKVADVSSANTLTFTIGPKDAGHNNRITRISLQINGKTNGSKITVYEEVWSGTGTGTVVTSDKFDTGATVGEWFNLRIEYYEGLPSEPGTSRVKVKINQKTVLVSGNVYSAQLDASAAKQVTFIHMSSFGGCVYLDNTYFDQTVSTYVEEPVNVPIPGTGSGGSGNGSSGTGSTDKPATDDKKSTNVSLNFDSATAFPMSDVNFILSDVSAYANAASASGAVVDSNGKNVPQWKGSISIQGTDNKYIHIEDPKGDGGNSGVGTDEEALNLDKGQAHLKMTGIVGIGNTVSYEMKIRFDELDGQLKKSTVHFDMSLRVGDTRKVRVYFATDSNGKVNYKVDASGVETKTTEIIVPNGEWFTFRVEYTDSGDAYDASKCSVKIYVNNTLVDTVTALSNHGYVKASDITRADFLISKAFVGVVDIDDLKFKIYDSTNP